MRAAIDWAKVRSDFPILSQTVHGHPLAYLDNAATTQKPQRVLDRLNDYWAQENANVHRGVHALSHLATESFESARESVRRFVNAKSTSEIIFTKGCTEAINLVATGLDRMGHFAEGDVILVSTMEHHSNIVPWQMVAGRTGAKVVAIPISNDGEIDQDAYASLLENHSVKLVAVAHVSNALGVINPIYAMTGAAHRAGALILVDGAQATGHWSSDVENYDVDFYTLSGHKLYAPTGIGVLYGRQSLLEAMPPYQGGGDMIRTVSFEKTTFAELPAKFEAGTPNIAGAIGLGSAIDYLSQLGNPVLDDYARLENARWQKHNREIGLRARAEKALQEIPGIRIVGKSAFMAGIISFTLDGIHPHDVGTILDDAGIAVRTGHHCCMPLMRRLGLPGTTRASFAFYNTEDEVDRLIAGVKRVQEMFR